MATVNFNSFEKICAGAIAGSLLVLIIGPIKIAILAALVGAVEFGIRKFVGTSSTTTPSA